MDDNDGVATSFSSLEVSVCSIFLPFSVFLSLLLSSSPPLCNMD